MFGDDRRRRINLGGVQSTSTHQAVLEQTHTLRSQRQQQKRAQEAASVIQARWRAHVQRQIVRRQLLDAFDKEPLGTVMSTRLLVLAGGEETRLSKWAHAAVQAGNSALWQPYMGPEAASWLVLVRQIAVMILRATSRAPQ